MNVALPNFDDGEIIKSYQSATIVCDPEIWLKYNSLEFNHLDYNTLSNIIGTNILEDHDENAFSSQKNINRKSLFQHYTPPSVEKPLPSRKVLTSIENRLTRCVSLYRSRLRWLTSSSREMFGLISESSICIVLDVNTRSKLAFNQFTRGVDILLDEQMKHLSYFNIVRNADGLSHVSYRSIPATRNNIVLAKDWLWMNKMKEERGYSNTVEAMIHAGSDKNISCVYLLTEGDSAGEWIMMLPHLFKSIPVPVHVCMFHPLNQEHVNYFRSLCIRNKTKFNVYHPLAHGHLPDSATISRADLLKRLEDMSVRKDCLTIYEELSRAEKILTRIRILLHHCADDDLLEENDDYCSPLHPLRRWQKKGQSSKKKVPTSMEYAEKAIDNCEDLRINDWLNKFGIDALGMNLHEVLSQCPHSQCPESDAWLPARPLVLDLEELFSPKFKPKLLTDPILPPAKMCQYYVHVQWTESSVAHIELSNEVHRLYVERMNRMQNIIATKILKMGGTHYHIFGSLQKIPTCLLVESTVHMKDYMQNVIDHVVNFFTSRVHSTMKVNVMTYGKRTQQWQERCVEMNLARCYLALNWLKTIKTKDKVAHNEPFEAVKKDKTIQQICLFAFSKIYMSSRTALELKNTIIHVVSCNPYNIEVNNELSQLAKRFQGNFLYLDEEAYFNCHGLPEPSSSGDVSLLLQEYDRGEKQVIFLNELRDACAIKRWDSGLSEDENNPRKSTAHISKIIENRNLEPRKSIAKLETKRKETKETIQDFLSVFGLEARHLTILDALKLRNVNIKSFYTQPTQINVCNDKVDEIIETFTPQHLKHLAPELCVVGQLSNDQKKYDRELQRLIRIYKRYFVESMFKSLDDSVSSLGDLSTKSFEDQYKTLSNEGVALLSESNRKEFELLIAEIDKALGCMKASRLIFKSSPNSSFQIANSNVLSGVSGKTDEDSLNIQEKIDETEDKDEDERFSDKDKDEAANNNSPDTPVQDDKTEVKADDHKIPRSEGKSDHNSSAENKQQSDNVPVKIARAKPKSPSKKKRKHSKSLENYRILVLDRSNGFYYPGIMIKKINYSLVTVRLLISENIFKVNNRDVFTIPHEKARPYLRVGDRVMAPHRLDDSSIIYLPGIIYDFYKSYELMTTQTLVKFYTDDVVSRLKTDLVKIDKSRFETVVRYLCVMKFDDPNRMMIKPHVPFSKNIKTKRSSSENFGQPSDNDGNSTSQFSQTLIKKQIRSQREQIKAIEKSIEHESNLLAKNNQILMSTLKKSMKFKSSDGAKLDDDMSSQ